MVIDLERELGALEGQTFDLIIICSVLEHSRSPWILAKNLSKILTDDGLLFSCHPWVWRYHKYPDDYFRFSPRGIQVLFNELSYWTSMLYATTVEGEFFSFTEDENIDNKLAIIDKNKRKYLPYLQSMTLGSKSKSKVELYENILRNVFQKRR